VRVQLLAPDVAPDTVPPSSGRSPIQGSEPRSASCGWAFEKALDAIGRVLSDATAAEDNYANSMGSLQDAMYHRAQADVALSVATAAAQRAAQAVQTLLNLQI
jgi:flagellar hook-basal body complex protein FliE